MRFGAAALAVVGACSFDHGVAMQPDGGCRRSGTPWWDPGYTLRYRIDTGNAPAGYTIALDDTPLERFFGGEGFVNAAVVIDHTTLVDRVFERGNMYVKVPAKGELWVYANGNSTQLPLEDPSNVFLFATDFGAQPALDQFDLEPPGDWSTVTTDHGLYTETVLRVTGAGRHPAAIKNLALANGEILASVRFLSGMGQQHNGLAARSNSMLPATMDGFVGQLQADVQHARIAEYTNGVSPPAELATMNREVMRDRWYQVALRFVDDKLTLFIDGQVALTTTKSGADGNLLGLFAHDCDVEFDAVRVRPAVEPEPLATLGPEENYCD